MFFKIDRITGFACSDPVIWITNEKGKSLYYLKNPEGQRITFNLIPSKGKGWKTDNKLTALPRPLVYTPPPLIRPKFERVIKEHKYRVSDNPNKCTVDFSGDSIDVNTDKSLWYDAAIPFLVFIFYHEIGHYYWGGEQFGTPAYFQQETNCDIFACYHMLKRGYNPSQCWYAIKFSLSQDPNAQGRKERVRQYLSKVKCE